MKEKDKNYYDHLRKNEWKNTADFGPSTRVRYNIILNLIKKYANKNIKILDIGCGTGNLLRLLKQKGFRHIYGSDFSKESVKLTKNKFGKNVFQADLTQLENYKNNKYDLIICSEVLEHIKNDNLAIKNLRKLLNKNGLIILSVPFNKKYWSNHDIFSGHVRRYEKEELERKVLKQKFIILESRGWGNLIYSIYHKILIKKSPSAIMGKKNKFLKKMISKLLYFSFFIENFSKSKKRARRLFIVAKKNE